MFEIQVVEQGLVRLTGRLDASQSDHAQSVLAELHHSLTLDCAQLDYISSAGIGVLMETYKRLTARGQTVRLVNLLPRVRNVFAYAGLDRIFTIE
ncbi:MAG TPA: STAS domain-containing protein [Candidatus Sulfotelmatobacter sp.]|nr:STAS domain-containing protein [Candidatus Sulfotelmatobacter sp.]